MLMLITMLRGVRGCVCGCAWVCVGVRGCAWVCVGVRGCAWVCVGVRGCACVQAWVYVKRSQYPFLPMLLCNGLYRAFTVAGSSCHLVKEKTPILS